MRMIHTKTNKINTLKSFEVIHSMFINHTGMKLGRINRKKFGEYINL